MAYSDIARKRGINLDFGAAQAPHVKPAPPLGQPFNEMPNASPRRVPLWKWLAVSVAFMGALGVVGFIIMSAVTGGPTQRTAATATEVPSTSAWPTVEAAPVVEAVAVEGRPVEDTAAQMVFTMIRAWRPGERMVVQLDGGAIVCVDVGDNPNGIGAKIYNGDYTSCE